MRSTEEILDIFDDKYNHIGTEEKTKVHQKGLWHRVFVCLVINKSQKTAIFQKKYPSKYGFNRPDCIDISVGGHYQAGESIEDGVRKVKEELNLDVSFNQLISIGIRQTTATINPDCIANEFQHIFLLPIDKKIGEFNLEGDEVNGLVEFDIQDGIDILLKKTKEIYADEMVYINNKPLVKKVSVTLQDFTPAYLELDQLYLKLLIAAKRYIRGDDINEILF